MLEVEKPADMKSHIGEKIGTSEWVTVDQVMIDKFAEATGDHQWIHVDVERAKREMPGGKTIAHGYLTLSLLPRLSHAIYTIRKRSRGINYGSNRVRFTSPVPAGARVRLHQTLNNIIRSAYESGVRKLLFLGSSCIYPKFAPQPIPETALLSGPLEPTNEAYAIAKIAGVKLCQAFSREYGANFISAMPTNVYGPNDNFDLETSHVLAALLRKAHEAKTRSDQKLIVWGTGKPRREFLHVDDLASACLLLLEKYDSPEIINVGCGEDVSIRELAELICDVVGFDGELAWDASKPDGTPRKLLDVSKLRALGWKPTITLHDGIAQTYQWFLANWVHR